MNRRTVLASTAAALTGSLVGCVGTTTESETPTPTRTERPATPHSLYVMNYTTTTDIARVRVLDGDGTAVVDGRYELPSERGIEFGDIGGWERTYTVALAIDGIALEPVTWETPSCEAIEEAPRGSRDGHVRVREDDTDGLRGTIAVDDCDAIIGQKYPTGPAKGFRVEERATTTVGT